MVGWTKEKLDFILFKLHRLDLLLHLVGQACIHWAFCPLFLQTGALRALIPSQEPKERHQGRLSPIYDRPQIPHFSS